MAAGRSSPAAVDFGARERECVVQVMPGVKQICEGCFLYWTANAGLLVVGRLRAADRCKQGFDPLGGSCAPFLQFGWFLARSTGSGDTLDWRQVRRLTQFG